MKRISCFFLLLVFPSFGFAQGFWNAETSNTTHQLNSVHFADKDNGWTVGSNGTILHTNNGGANWQVQASNTVNNLNAVFAITKEVSYVVGDSGVALKTIDGGSHWSKLSVPTDFTLRSIHFLSETTGWIVGGGWQEGGATQWAGKILFTNDGGNNWTLQVATHYCFFDVEFPNDQNGYVIGFDTADPLLYFTNNGGVTWDSVYFYYGIFPPYSMRFVDADHGFLTFESGSPQNPSSLMSTSDRGSHWAMGPSFQYPMQSLFFLDERNGYICGDRGTIYYTNTGGNSWKRQEISTDKDLKYVFCINDSTGWVVGADGTILKTSQVIPPAPKIQVGIWTDRASYMYSDTVAMVITAYNPSADTVVLNFGTSCQVSYTIDDFDFMDHAFCTAVPTSRTVPPFGTIHWDFLKYPHKNLYLPFLALGPHTVTGQVLGYAMSDTLMIFVTPSTSVSGVHRNVNDFLLGQNYPNPFNATTTVPFTLSTAGRVQITLYNNLGQKVRTLLNDYRTAGLYNVRAELDELPSGLYWCRLQLGARSQTIKLILAK